MTTIDALLADYEVERPPPADRPWVLLNLVLSADGHASIDGRVTELTSPTDQRLFHHLRAQCDHILVGAATVRAEHYGPVRIPDDVAHRRTATGRAAVPSLVVVSRSLDVDLERITSTGQPVTVMTCASSDASRRSDLARSATVIVAGDDLVDLRQGLGELRRRGAQIVLCEGGAFLNSELAQAGLIDEVCVTIAPVLGGDPSTSAGALLRGKLRLVLQHACELDGNVFLRWLVQ